MMYTQKDYDAHIARCRKKEKRVMAGERHLYMEHHIFPESMGGTDEPENLINLLHLDHLKAHIMLGCIHGGTQWSPIYFFMGEVAREGHKYTKKELEDVAFAMAEAQKAASETQLEVWDRPGYREQQSKNRSEEWDRPGYREQMSQTQSEAWERPGYREQQSQVQSEVWDRPGYRERQSQVQSEVWGRPGYREQTSQAQSEAWGSPGLRGQQSKTMSEVWERPGYREQQSKNRSEEWDRPGYREQQSQVQSEVWERPGLRERQSKTLSEVWGSPGLRERQSKTQLEVWERPGYRGKMSLRNSQDHELRRLFFELSGYEGNKQRVKKATVFLWLQSHFPRLLAKVLQRHERERAERTA